MEKLVSSDYYLRCTLYINSLFISVYVYDMYLLCRLFEKTPESLLEKIQFSTIIIHALKTLHGEVAVHTCITGTSYVSAQVGAALRVDVIQYQPTPTISAILRTAKK